MYFIAADRAKQIKTSAHVNQTATDKLIKDLIAEKERLLKVRVGKPFGCPFSKLLQVTMTYRTHYELKCIETILKLDSTFGEVKTELVSTILLEDSKAALHSLANNLYLFIFSM